MRGYVTDLEGRGEIPLRPGEEKGSAIIISQGLPAQLVSLDLHPSPLTVRLDGFGGYLKLSGEDYRSFLLRANGASVPVALLYAFRNIMNFVIADDFLSIGPVAAGYYTLCPVGSIEAPCPGGRLEDGGELILGD